jgi:predicted transcriptional regulator
MMTTITLELPEELVVRLDPLRDQLPELLAER